jgi:hypothetical protein
MDKGGKATFFSDSWGFDALHFRFWLLLSECSSVAVRDEMSKSCAVGWVTSDWFYMNHWHKLAPYHGNGKAS